MADNIDINAINAIVRTAMEAIDINGVEQQLTITSDERPIDKVNATLIVNFLERYPSTVTKLTFMCCQFSRQATETIRQFLAITTSLHEFSLLDGRIDTRTLRRLLSGLHQNTSVTKLTLARGCLEGEAGGSILSTLLLNNSHLKQLLCSKLAIGPEGARTLQPGLAANNSLELLFLCTCELGDTGVSMIMETLKEHHNISQLNLTSNGLTSNALPSVTQFLRQHPSIKILGLDNNPGLFDHEANTNSFSSVLSRSSRLVSLQLNFCRMPGHAVIAICQHVAIETTISHLGVYDTEQLQGHSLDNRLQIIPKMKNINVLYINLDFMHQSILSAIYWNTSIRNLFSGENENEINSGPVLFNLERNRWLDRDRWLDNDNNVSRTSITPACLHTLRTKEQDAYEMSEMKDVLQNYWRSGEGPDFWDRQDNTLFVNERMVRLLFSLAIKAVLECTGSEDVYAFEMLLMYGKIKCGSFVAAWDAMAGKTEVLMETMTASQVSFRYLCHHLQSIWKQHPTRSLVYILNVLSPCDCLRPEVKRRSNGGINLMLACSNQCGKQEESDARNDRYGCCRMCQLAVYCSQSCQKGHWNGTRRVTSTGAAAAETNMQSHSRVDIITSRWF